jgi:two-component system heavy metal sensor histidine kinase CusS
MFLKSAKILFSRKSSIAGQLTLFYSASSFLLITAISLFLYWTMTTILYSAAHQFLSDEINIIQNILVNKPENTLALKQEVNDIPKSLQSSVYHYYIRVLDSNNTIIAETPRMNLILQGNTFFNNQAPHSLIKEEQWQSSAGNHYLLMQATVTSTTENKAWFIQIALDNSYQQRIINKYRTMVFIILLGGALFSIALGYLISRKGMRRLYELTEATKKITADALQQPIDPEFWPKELNELGMAYNQMLNRIEGSISKLLQFSDDLAHELRTPINNLMGEAEIALSRPTTSEEYQQVIGSILEELNRIYQTIENLLFLARAENPQSDLQKSLLNTNHEINVMCRAYQAVADEKNIKLYCNGETTIRADVVMFRRMIGNLLSNAINYSTCGGEVVINVNESAEKTVQITITDNGIGIEAEHLPNLFQRFYRVDAARTAYSGGSGLGLSIVKLIVDLHQGTIAITSLLNKGTSILITIPK